MTDTPEEELAKPSGEQIAEFLDSIERVFVFEATHRAIRGYGAFLQEECPNLATVAVLAWLKSLATPPTPKGEGET